ncbi:hypothetical protein E4T39_08494 [Aureobasidium subglaciale]|nr:hypothetical protein E4T39_08494 [Aureobasidium subglaciale]
MATVDKHHSLILLKSARSIPTNFGFIFEAGPIQLSESAQTESPSTSNAPPITTAFTKAHHHPEPQASLSEAAPKRKRVVKEDEDDDGLWFKKRSKKTTTKQEHNEVSVDVATSIVAPDKPQPEVGTKQTKRKVVRKRILVPKPRQRVPTKPQPDTQYDQPMPIPEPTQEAPTEVKTKTRKPAMVKVVKHKTEEAGNLVVTIPEKDQGDELSNHSLHTISASQSAAPQTTKPSQDVQNEVVEQRSRRKVAPVKRAARNQKPNDAITTRKVMSEDSHTEGKGSNRKPKTTTTKQPKAVADRAEKELERVQEVQQVDAATPAKELSNPVPARQEAIEELAQPPKKRKLVRRVRVPKVPAAPAILEVDSSSDHTLRKDDTKPVRSKGSLKERNMNSPPENGESKDDPRSSENRSKNNKEVVDALPKDMSVRKSSAEAEDIDFSLFEATQTTKKSTKTAKAPKRIFNDDSDIDLDQMLSGIAAMAGTKGVTKAPASRSSRVVKKKAAA